MLRVLAVLLLIASPVSAEGFKKRAKAENMPPLPIIEFYCTGSSGERYELGDVICIAASCQTWMARCDMSQNNVMWRKMQDGCPTASAAPSLQQRFDQLKRVPVLPNSTLAG